MIICSLDLDIHPITECMTLDFQMIGFNDYKKCGGMPTTLLANAIHFNSLTHKGHAIWKYIALESDSLRQDYLCESNG